MSNKKTQRVKVCHLTSVHNRRDTRIFIKECKSLQAHGYEVYLIVADGQGDEVDRGIRIIDIGRPKGRLNRILGTTKKVYHEALKVDADVYHFHDPELIFTGSKLLKKGKKVIYDVHEDVPRQIMTKPYIHPFLTKGISYFFEKIENWKSKRFDFIITSTAHIQERFLKINNNTKAIHNFPFLQEFAEIQVNWADRRDVVCYVGGISKVRGNYENVEALSYIKRKMLLAGVFLPETYKQDLMNSAGWEYVEFLGFLDREGIQDVLSKSKAGLVTLHPTINYLDSLPVKMFEYMAAGIPVIASDFDLWKSIIEKENCGICVDPLNVEEIAKAIDRILADNKSASEMGQNGKNAVMKKYNWETEKYNLLTIYDKLIS
ncbi:glycosyltransferase family 4 protein [Flagellimonas sp.]|uniref:glycosyltransferase family 4 protein n=1 Tax=Flagellimonas sp. TaxID=2058762 RepID=UPI003AB46FA2